MRAKRSIQQCAKSECLERRVLFAAGEVDITFGRGGFATPGVAWTPNDMALDAAGRIVLAGTRDGRFGLGRLLPDGQPDATFGDAGSVVTAFFTPAECNGVAIQPDGKIVAVGTVRVSAEFAPRNNAMAVIRYLPDGTLDPDFGDRGIRLTDIGGGADKPDDVANDVAVLDDGTILVAGRAFNDRQPGRPSHTASSDFALVRYDAKGGLAGVTLTDFSFQNEFGTWQYTHEEANAMVLLPGGGVFLTGGSMGWSYNFLRVARYSEAGVQTYQSLPDWGIRVFDVEAAALQPGGKIILGAPVSGSGSRFGLIRVDPATGNVDKSFGSNGVAISQFGWDPDGDDLLRDIAVQGDGKIVAVGAWTRYGPLGLVGPKYSVARHLPDGAMDTSFGNNGIAFPTVGGASAVTIQPDGDILVAGERDWFATVVRIEAGPAAPPPNRPPVVDAGPDRVADEGQSFSLSAAVSDPDGDPVSVLTTVSRNGSVFLGSVLADVQFVARDDGTYEFTVRADDGRGGVTTDTALITVANVPPVFDVGPDAALAPSSGGRFQRVISFTDPGEERSWSATFFSGEPIGGEGIRAAAVDPIAKTITIDYTYRTAGTYAARLDVWDGPGEPVADALTVSVAFNVPPTAVLVAAPIVEGERLFLDASGSVDPDGDALTYEWDVFGDGAFRIPGPLSLQQLDWSILQAQGMDDGPATYTAFRVRVTDSAGNVAVSAPATFTVSDAPPAVVAGTAQAGPVLPGAAVTVGASFSDPGRDGPYAALWEWGDGTTTVQPDVAKGALSASHAYAGAGVYVPRLTITDADGIPGRATLAPVTVITPAEATQAVTRQVRALAAGGDLTAGQSAVLVSLLDVAARQLSRGNEAVAAIVLDVFRLAVNTYTRLGILTAGEANPLLRSTDQILANLRG